MPGFIKPLSPFEYLDPDISAPVIDVRSPGEFVSGHIPGAINIPLFDDSQRAEIGTTYKAEGNLKAVLRGIDLTAPEMSAKLRRAVDLADNGLVKLYCWRGGMRSEAMAWLFSLAGINCILLRGGYKAYRNHILDDLGRERRYVILGGLTGSGKTHILKNLMTFSEQVTDLEGLASHRGSAFGALGQPPQPSSEHFANMLFDDLKTKHPEEIIWLEDESKNIGTVFMPDNFYNRMQAAPVIALMMSIDTRLPRLLQEYASFPAGQIIDSIVKISRRLGGDKTKLALEAVKTGDFPTAIRITLEYYDKSYNYGLSRRASGQVIFVHTDTDDIALNAAKVREAAASFR